MANGGWAVGSQLTGVKSRPVGRGEEGTLLWPDASPKPNMFHAVNLWIAWQMALAFPAKWRHFLCLGIASLADRIGVHGTGLKNFGALKNFLHAGGVPKTIRRESGIEPSGQAAGVLAGQNGMPLIKTLVSSPLQHGLPSKARLHQKWRLLKPRGFH